jgi:hypothetical protein
LEEEKNDSPYKLLTHINKSKKKIEETIETSKKRSKQRKIQGSVNKYEELYDTGNKERIASTRH